MKHNTLTALTLPLFILGLLLLPATDASAAAGDTTVHSGTWSKKTYSASGTWKIVKNGDDHFVVLDSKFKTKSAPDLKLFLTKSKASSLTGKNATKNAVRIAKLKSNKGAQRYKLPKGTSPADYKTLIIHCEKYSKLWVTGTLK
ncbi:MAG: DM13 domain-containing protein [Phycisphaeraceae bacterium]|nr:DM13 domain-containing protein [Phycisphaeraceae bacterium]